MVAPFNIVYNTVADIIFIIEGFYQPVRPLAAPGGGALPNRGNYGRKTIQTRDSPNAEIRSDTSARAGTGSPPHRKAHRGGYRTGPGSTEGAPGRAGSLGTD